MAARSLSLRKKKVNGETPAVSPGWGHADSDQSQSVVGFRFGLSQFQQQIIAGQFLPLQPVQAFP
jgi:hypothetical protein